MSDRATNLFGALAIGVREATHAAMRAAVRLDNTVAAALLVVRERPGQSITDLAAVLRMTHSGAR